MLSTALGGAGHLCRRRLSVLNGRMGASWLLVWTDVHRRWPTVVAMTMLVGFAGTFVLTAATGARRADSALGRFLDATEMWDGSIEVDFAATEAVLADLAAQPEVAAATAFVFIPLVSEEIEFPMAGLGAGWLRDVYRPRIISGRLPDPTRVNEILVNEETARRHHLIPGDVVVLEDFLGLGIVQPMTIVGIHRGVTDLALADTYSGSIATEAFGRRFGDAIYDFVAGTPEEDEFRTQIVAIMSADVADLRYVLDSVAARHGAARPRVADRSTWISPIERALAVQVEAFWILAAVSGASSLILLGMAVGRLAAGSSHPDETLRALGVGSMSRASVSLAVPALVVIVGCVLAVCGALPASWLVPLGSARLVEPDPGIWVDPKTSLVGALALATGVLVLAAVLSRVDRLRTRRPTRRSRSPLQLPLQVTLGHDLAYRESNWGRLALAAAGVGLGLVVSVSVFTASLDRLINSPSLFGSDYEVRLYPEDGVEPEEAFVNIDLDDPTIESAAISRLTLVTVAGDLVEALVIDPVRGPVGVTILRGRAPQADDEVVLGPTTANRLGLDVGEEIIIAGTRERRMRIVGEAVLPLHDVGAYGDVMWLTPAAAERLEIEPTEPQLLLNLAEGVTQDDLAAAIGDPGGAVSVPDDVTNLDGVGQIPAALATFGALLSAAVLAFALVDMVRRRRHDLAILCALGASPRQIWGSVLTACLLIVGPGAVFGIVIGAVLGRAYWTSVAVGVPVVAQPVVPLALVALIALGALATGCMLVARPARLAARIHPGEILRRD